jgi:hypothetical protein
MENPGNSKNSNSLPDTSEGSGNIRVFATAGDRCGEIDLIWQPHQKATAYLLQVLKGNSRTGRWRDIDIVTRSSYTAAGLKSRKIYRFRIAPLIRSVPGAWSTTVTIKAP